MPMLLGLHSSTFVEVCFWTKDWVSVTRVHSSHSSGFVGAQCKIFTHESFGYFCHLRCLRWQILEAMHHRGLRCPCWLLPRNDKTWKEIMFKCWFPVAPISTLTSACLSHSVNNKSKYLLRFWCGEPAIETRIILSGIYFNIRKCLLIDTAIEPKLTLTCKVIFCWLSKQVLIWNLEYCKKNPIYSVFIALHYLFTMRKNPDLTFCWNSVMQFRLEFWDLCCEKR